MRKRVFGRHLKRDTNERKALFKNLMTELVLHEKINTTEEKAKAIRGKVEKLVTKAKNKGAQAEYLLQPYLSAEAVKKVIGDIAPRFAQRPGGYTRLIKLGNRFGDNASMAILELVERKKPEARSQKSEKKVTEEEIEAMIDEPSVIQEAEIISEEPAKKGAKVQRGKGAKTSEDTKEKKTEKKTVKKKSTEK